MKKTVDNRVLGWYNNQRRQGRYTSSGGLAQLGERLHGMQEVSGSIPLFSTKKALYFAGSTVLFFLLRPRGLHCFACSVFGPVTPRKKYAAPGADRAKAKPRKALGAASLIYVYGSVRCGCRDTPPTRHTRRAADGSRPAGRIRRSGRHSRRPAPPRGSGRCSPFPVRWPRGRR